MDVRMPDGTIIQNVPDGITKAQLSAKYSAHLDATAPAQQTGPQPTIAQDIVSSPIGRLVHNTVVQPIEGAASLGSRFLATAAYADKVGGAVDKAISKYIETPYQDAIAAQRNRPGYAQARQAADARMAPYGDFGLNRQSGFNDQVVAPFMAPLAGVAGGLFGGSLNAANAASDAQDAAQAAYAKAHPRNAAVAQIIGGLAAAPTDALDAAVAARRLPVASQPSTTGDALAQIAGVQSGVGGRPLTEAFKAGAAGGPEAEAFQANLRGDVPVTDVIEQAKKGLSAIKAEKNAVYRSGMADISNDKTILSFEPVDDALAKSSSVANFKGVDIAPKTAQARQEVADIIDNWKKLDPAEYHTPEGFDALKQQLGDLRDSYPYGDRSRLVVDNAYNAVRGAITKQAPTYGKVMSEYENASDQIDNIQKTLSLKPGTAVDTALRKLQSTMRDAVNTNFGQRAKLAQTLNDATGGTLMPSLAGQALHSWVPRGIMRGVTGGELAAMAATAVHNPAAAIGMAATLPLSSPRLMGEGAYYAGKGIGALVSPLSIPALTAQSQIPYGLFGSYAMRPQYQGQ